MKKLIYLPSIIFALTVFTAVSANAQSWSSQNDQGQNQNDQDNQDGHSNQGNHGDQDDHNHGHDDGGDSSSTQLPINGGVEFLMVAGLIIGIIAVKRYKTAKTVTIQE